VRLFKNRGDIYISKSGANSSKQAKILFTLLIFIVIFTVAFLVFLSQRYDSVAEFFAKGEVTQAEDIIPIEDDNLPKISGKTNFLIMETDDEETEIHYIFLLQADKDNLAYKVTSLPVDMTVKDKNIYDIFSEGGAAALQTQLTEFFGFDIDYQVQFKASAFAEFLNKLGSFVYTANQEIKFSGGEEDDTYSLRITAGEQKLSGKEISSLVRYYAQEEKNYQAENELLLRALTGLLNQDNYQNAEALFRQFIKAGNTNITVRDYENGKNALMIYCTKNDDITGYSAVPEMDGDALSAESLKQIKGYFSK